MNKCNGLLAIIACTILPFASLQAQEPTPLPTLEHVFAPPNASLDPDPCFEFACFNGAVFDRNTLAARGATYAAIYVYTRDRDGTWSLQATLKNPNPPIIVNVMPNRPDPGYVDRDFGTHLALYGNDLFASALWYDETNPQTPARSETHVFRRHGGKWRHVQPIDGAGPMALHRGTALIAGAGCARVFRRWARQYIPEATLPAPSAAATLSSLALHGNTAVLSTAGDETNTGEAFVYQRFGWHWFYLQTLSPAGDMLGQRFGASVATDGRRIAIGAPAATAPVSATTGVVYTFERAGWKWRRAAIIEDPLANEPDIQGFRSFGTAVDVQGRRLLVSASNAYPFAQEPRTHLFQRVRRQWQPAAHIGGEARNLQLSRGSALVDSRGMRFGTFPAIYDLPAP